MDELRDRCLGPEKERTRDSVAFERTHRAVKTRGGRAYNIAANKQKPRNVINPALGGKFTGEIDADLQLRSDLINVSRHCTSICSNVLIGSFYRLWSLLGWTPCDLGIQRLTRYWMTWQSSRTLSEWVPRRIVLILASRSTSQVLFSMIRVCLFCVSVVIY